jgi:hypothetical protein
MDSRHGSVIHISPKAWPVATVLRPVAAVTGKPPARVLPGSSCQPAPRGHAGAAAGCQARRSCATTTTRLRATGRMPNTGTGTKHRVCQGGVQAGAQTRRHAVWLTAVCACRPAIAIANGSISGWPSGTSPWKATTGRWTMPVPTRCRPSCQRAIPVNQHTACWRHLNAGDGIFAINPITIKQCPGGRLFQAHWSSCRHAWHGPGIRPILESDYAALVNH